MLPFTLCTTSGLIRSLMHTFADPRWPTQQGSVPKLVIESMMSDETSHKVKVPSSVPPWLDLVKARMRSRITKPAINGQPSHAQLDDITPSRGMNRLPSGEPTVKRRKIQTTITLRTRQSTQSYTWSVSVIRRSLSWLTPSGQLMFAPLASPPTALKRKGAAYLWNVRVMESMNRPTIKSARTHTQTHVVCFCNSSITFWAKCAPEKGSLVWCENKTP